MQAEQRRSSSAAINKKHRSDAEPHETETMVMFEPYNPVVLHTDKHTGKWTNPSILFFGGRRTGKSTKGKELFYRIRRKFAIAFLWTLTGMGTRVFGSAFYNVFSFDTLDMTQVGIAIGLMKYLKISFPDGIYGLELNALFCFDDCGSVKESRDKLMNQLTNNGRNDCITVCTMVQMLTQVSPAVRDNSEVFITNRIRKSDREDIWKQFFKEIDDFHMFDACVDHYTKSYGSLVSTPPPPEYDCLSEFIFTFNIDIQNPTPAFVITSPFMELIAFAFQASEKLLEVKSGDMLQSMVDEKHAAQVKAKERQRKILHSGRKGRDQESDEKRIHDAAIREYDDSDNDVSAHKPEQRKRASVSSGSRGKSKSDASSRETSKKRERSSASMERKTKRALSAKQKALSESSSVAQKKVSSSDDDAMEPGVQRVSNLRDEYASNNALSASKSFSDDSSDPDGTASNRTGKHVSALKKKTRTRSGKLLVFPLHPKSLPPETDQIEGAISHF